VWSERQKLTASDAAASDFFGGAVGISGDTVAVGAMLHDGSAGSNAGAAYVFGRSLDAWSERQKLTASDPSAWAQLGNALSLAGETLVVGALADRPVPGGAAGSAYVYVREGTSWTEQAKLRASGGAGGDDFGVSVSLAGDTALIGNSLDDTVDGTDAGSASVRVRAGSSWSEQQLLPPAVPTGLYTLPPCRVVDTRTTASPLRGNSIAAFPVAGRCLVPGDARAVVAIFTAVGPTQAGNLRLFPDDQIAPLASALNFAAGQTRAGNGVVLLSRDGNVAVQCDMPPGAPGQTHFVLDVVAYFR
jgi:hypothetical protein